MFAAFLVLTFLPRWLMELFCRALLARIPTSSAFRQVE